MITIKNYPSGFIIFIASIIFSSCTFDAFDYSRLAKPDDLIPYISAPLAYGTFKVDDLNPGTYTAATPITSAGLSLDSVMLNKTGISFRSSSIDTVYLITRITNNTSADIEYTISLVNRSTGIQLGASSVPAKVPAGATDHEIKFTLGPAEQDNLQAITPC
jgi:hypothetical protein